MSRDLANLDFVRMAQARMNLKVDGWAGNVTRSKFMELVPDQRPPAPEVEARAELEFNQAKFFAEVRRTVFGGRLAQNTVTGINGILAAYSVVGDSRPDSLAYILSTAFGEVGKNMLPVREGFAKTDAAARRAVKALAKARGPQSAVARYSLPAGPYGHVYYGRGHVQLTWLDNYRDSSADAGVDLVKYPDTMLDPVVSARIMILGMLDGRWNGHQRGLRHYLDRGDWIQARRTVNILDKAESFAATAQLFHAAILNSR